MFSFAQNVFSCFKGFNSLPNDKVLDRPNLTDLADDKINAGNVTNFVMVRVENIVGKGENAGYQHFLLFPQCFQEASFCYNIFKMLSSRYF